MKENTFEETVAGHSFSFEKLKLGDDELLFFVSTDMTNARSFFMSKTAKGEWIILYHNILGREVLRIESSLSQLLRERGY